MLSAPRYTLRVVPEPAKTVSTSSLDVSGSTIRVYGYEVGKPLTEPTMNEVFAAPGDCAPIAPDSAVSIAVEE